MKSALDIIKKALRIMKVVDPNQPLKAIDRNTALEGLNDLILHLPAQYNHLWTQTQGVLLMDKGQAKYSLGPNGARAVNEDDLYFTTTTANAAAAATTITLTSASGFTNGKQIGIILDSGSVHWTTISGAPSGLVVTLAAALPSAAASGSTVYAYSELIPRPQMITNAQFADRINNSEIPLIAWSRDDYFNQPDKTTQGSTSQYYYSPQLVNGDLYVWPTAYSNANVMKFTYIRPINIVEENIDSPDFPAEWYLPLSYKLAEMIMDEYYVTSMEQQLIKQKSDELMANVLSFDNSGDSIRVEIFRW